MHPIIVVEDERDVFDLLCMALEDEGYQVIGFRHPPTAESLESVELLRVFLLDLMLPGMTGIELASRLRANGFAKTPMIAMSASNVILRQAANANIFEEALSKPFDLSELLDTVERYAA